MGSRLPWRPSRVRPSRAPRRTPSVARRVRFVRTQRKAARYTALMGLHRRLQRASAVGLASLALCGASCNRAPPAQPVTHSAPLAEAAHASATEGPSLPLAPLDGAVGEAIANLSVPGAGGVVGRRG